MNWKLLPVKKSECVISRFPRNAFRHSRHKIWIWTAVDHFKKGILDWVVGDRSAETFEPLWAKVRKWNCYFSVTDGWKVYPQFIPDGDRIISKTYMTRVEAFVRG
jgi:IS1 family transposase